MDFVYIDQAQMHECLQLFDKNPWVRVGFDLHMASLLSSGIHFIVNGKEMNPEHKEEYSEVWCSFFRHVIRQHWCLGFAMVGLVKHPIFGRVPVCVDPAAVDVMYRRPVMGEPIFIIKEKYKEQASALSLVASNMRERGGQIPNTTVILHPGAWPTRDGKLRSKMMTIRADVTLADGITKSIQAETKWIEKPLFTTQTKHHEIDNGTVMREIATATQPISRIHGSDVVNCNTNPGDGGEVQVMELSTSNGKLLYTMAGDETKLARIQTTTHLKEMIDVREQHQQRPQEAPPHAPHAHQHHTLPPFE